MTTSNQASAVEFVVSYEGDALANHTMPVRDLAPALLALGQAFDRANSILNGDRASVALEIRATQQGSFEIALTLQQLFEGAVGFLSGDIITSSANIKELFFGGASSIGLVALIKRLKGSQPKQVETQDPENDKITLEIDGLRLSVPGKLTDLLRDNSLREQMEAVVRPVMKEGVDKVVFREGSRTLETVEKGEAQYFRQRPPVDATTTQTIHIARQRLKPASVNFSKKGKWKLSDGEKARWYAINDVAFMKEVEDGQRRFGSRDLLVCEVEMTQSVDAQGDLSLDYAITAVLVLIEPPEQGRMLEVTERD